MIRTLLLVVLLFSVARASARASDRYVRFQHDDTVRFGKLKGDDIQVLSGGLFPLSPPSGPVLKIKDVTLLPPTDARQIFAVGMNFASHLASSVNSPPPLFLKLPSSLIGSGQNINLPSDAKNVHFEGELVLVIGKTSSKIKPSEAADHIFGVTAGNDLSERYWQRRDLQWLRAKATDGFGPVGPAIATGLDYNNLELTTRLNGKIVQQENTTNMIHKPARVVSYLSQYITLQPGDLIFMGTPGRTSALSNGDVVSVEIENVGILTNTISAP